MSNASNTQFFHYVLLPNMNMIICGNSILPRISPFLLFKPNEGPLNPKRCSWQGDRSGRSWGTRNLRSPKVAGSSGKVRSSGIRYFVYVLYEHTIWASEVHNYVNCLATKQCKSPQQSKIWQIYLKQCKAWKEWEGWFLLPEPSGHHWVQVVCHCDKVPPVKCKKHFVYNHTLYKITYYV